MRAPKHLTLGNHLALGEKLMAARSELVSVYCATKCSRERRIIGRLEGEIETTQSQLDEIICAAVPRSDDPENLAPRVYYPGRGKGLDRRKNAKICAPSFIGKSSGAKARPPRNSQKSAEKIIPFRKVGDCLPTWLPDRERLTRLQILHSLFGRGRFTDDSGRFTGRSFTAQIRGVSLFVDLVDYDWIFGSDSGQGLIPLIVRVYGGNLTGSPKDIWRAVTGEALPSENMGANHEE